VLYALYKQSFGYLCRRSAISEVAKREVLGLIQQGFFWSDLFMAFMADLFAHYALVHANC